MPNSTIAYSGLITRKNIRKFEEIWCYLDKSARSSVSDPSQLRIQSLCLKLSNPQKKQTTKTRTRTRRATKRARDHGGEDLDRPCDRPSLARRAGAGAAVANVSADGPRVAAAEIGVAAAGAQLLITAHSCCVYARLACVFSFVFDGVMLVGLF